MPQWVRDEASGGDATATPWRAAAATADSGAAAQHVRHGPRTLRTLLVVLGVSAVAALGASVLHLGAASPLTAVNGSDDPAAAPRPPAGQEEGSRPRLALDRPVPAPADGGFRYIATHDPDATPVTWSPCRPIHVVVRTRNATSDGIGILRSALDEVSRDSGLRFVYDGTTTEDPVADRPAYQPGRYGDRWAPVLISWVTPQEDPDVTSRVLGLTRPTERVAGDGSPVWVSGQVEMSAALIASVQRRFGVIATRTVFLHELGHLVGLDHVGRPAQLMYPSYEPTTRTFAPEELLGLRSVGSGGCHPDI